MITPIKSEDFNAGEDKTESAMHTHVWVGPHWKYLVISSPKFFYTDEDTRFLSDNLISQLNTN